MKATKLSRSLVPLAALALSVGLSSASPGTQDGVAEAAAGETLPEARTIIDRFLEVTKLSSVIRTTRRMHLSGTFAIPSFGLEGKFDVWKGKPDKYLSVVDLGAQGGIVRQGTDGTTAWSSHSMMGDRLLDGAELLALEVSALYDEYERPSRFFESIETLGKESFQGVECYKLKLVMKPLEGMQPEETLDVRTMYDYYEVESGLLLASTVVNDGPTGRQEVTTVTTEYKEFGAARYASTSTMELSGMEAVITIESVEHDTFEDSVFDLPEFIRKLVEKKRARADDSPR